MSIDLDTLRKAFRIVGEDLAGRGLLVELAVYGGTAIMMQFDWRMSTEDVDAVVRDGYDERALEPSVRRAAEELGLAPDWLNDAVGMFTPLDEPDDLFAPSGSWPETGTPGLRVVVATPHYLLAMKLMALRSLDRGDKDLSDAKALAAHLGVDDPQILHDLYVSIHDEEPPPEVALRLPSVVGR